MLIWLKGGIFRYEDLLLKLNLYCLLVYIWIIVRNLRDYFNFIQTLDASVGNFVFIIGKSNFSGNLNPFVYFPIIFVDELLVDQRQIFFVTPAEASGFWFIGFKFLFSSFYRTYLYIVQTIKITQFLSRITNKPCAFNMDT